jgi:hypothetical protein
MPVIKKRVINSDSRDSTNPATATATGNARTRKTLNLERFTPSENLIDYSFIVYGEKKIGKTTLLGEFPGAYHFMFERNDSYSLHKSDIAVWEDFVELVPQFNTSAFKLAVIDNGRNAYNLALESAGRKHGFEHPGGQNDHGAAWAKVEKELYSSMRSLMQNGKGFCVLCHEVDKEVTTVSGVKFNKIMPDLPAAAARLFTGEAYNIFYYYREGTSRWLQILGDEYCLAGHRMKNHFLTTEGEAVWRIPMGESEGESYKNLMNAFNNKQKEANKPKTFAEKREALKKILKSTD